MFKVGIDTKGMIERLSDLEKKQFPFAAMLAINDAMFDTREGWRTAIASVFDRPTQLTLNAVL